jgi:hypothetical protein
LFLVVAGRGSVSGANRVWRPVIAGEAALWTAEEEHSARADTPLTAIVVDTGGYRLEVRARLSANRHG